MELQNITIKEDAMGKHHWTDRYVQILDFRNIVIFEQETLDVKIYLDPVDGTRPQKIWTWYVILPAHPSLNMYGGEYTIRFKLRDHYSDVTSETSADFIIVDGRNI